MALNVTTAVIGENCNTATASPSLAQWDVGQILKIEGVDLPSAYQVDFSTEYTRNAIQKIGNRIMSAMRIVMIQSPVFPAILDTLSLLILRHLLFRPFSEWKDLL